LFLNTRDNSKAKTLIPREHKLVQKSLTVKKELSSHSSKSNKVRNEYLKVVKLKIKSQSWTSCLKNFRSQDTNLFYKLPKSQLNQLEKSKKILPCRTLIFLFRLHKKQRMITFKLNTSNRSPSLILPLV